MCNHSCFSPNILFQHLYREHKKGASDYTSKLNGHGETKPQIAVKRKLSNHMQFCAKLFVSLRCSALLFLEII